VASEAKPKMPLVDVLESAGLLRRPRGRTVHGLWRDRGVTLTTWCGSEMTRDAWEQLTGGEVTCRSCRRAAARVGVKL
jgi:hypothetical protein